MEKSEFIEIIEWLDDCNYLSTDPTKASELFERFISINSEHPVEAQTLEEHEPLRKDCSTCIAVPCIRTYEPCKTCSYFNKCTQSV